jgi:hypothetical protein
MNNGCILYSRILRFRWSNFKFLPYASLKSNCMLKLYQPDWSNVLAVKCYTVRPKVMNYSWFNVARYTFEEFRCIIVLQISTSYF